MALFVKGLDAKFDGLTAMLCKLSHSCNVLRLTLLVKIRHQVIVFPESRTSRRAQSGNDRT